MAKMYSPSSPVLSSLDQSMGIESHRQPSRCLRFKYFTTFIVSTACLALLSASLATHKWIVSKPIRILKSNGGQTNFTALMLTAQSDQQDDQQSASNSRVPAFWSSLRSSIASASTIGALQTDPLYPSSASSGHHSTSHNNKFQGEIYFGLFKGVKVLNYGFGDRISPISVLQTYFAKENQQQPNNQQPQELISFKLWLCTLVCLSLAILFALIGSIFAIINFVMTLRGMLTGPIGLVIWNAVACFSCLLVIVTWLIEYFVRLQANVLTTEEVQNGWTSDKRSQFGYSFYFVVLSFALHLVNIFIVSLVQFETWTSSKAAKRQARGSNCEGVIMLY